MVLLSLLLSRQVSPHKAVLLRLLLRRQVRCRRLGPSALRPFCPGARRAVLLSLLRMPAMVLS